MNTENIRWKQRFANYGKALQELDEAVALSKTRELSKLETQGLIQGFEYTYELAWNTLKDYLQEQGHQELHGSRDTIREAFNVGLISQGETWMAMFRDRNKTSHTYNRQTAEEIATAIFRDYYGLFHALKSKLEKLV
jgi:nucleotidyltransferase substrate binding protein (TIGR01987 family)